jgi:hypothetical protein
MKEFSNWFLNQESNKNKNLSVHQSLTVDLTTTKKIIKKEREICFVCLINVVCFFFLSFKFDNKNNCNNSSDDKEGN